MSYRSWYLLFYGPVSFCWYQFCRDSHISVVNGETLLRQLSINWNNCTSFLDFGGNMSVGAWLFLDQGLCLAGKLLQQRRKYWYIWEDTYLCEAWSLAVCIPRHPFLPFSLFQCGLWPTHWSLKYWKNGISLNSSSIFFWNMSPAGAALNGNLIYQSKTNGQEPIVKYDDLLPYLLV